MPSSLGRSALPVARLVSCALLLASAAPASAAPHLTGAKPEPPSHVGERDASGGAPMSRLAASAAGAPAPSHVRILLLKVDFQPDSDHSTTGTGVWSDPAYAHQGDPDHWLSVDTGRFASYYAEVSYGRFSVEIVAMPPAPRSAYRLPSQMRRYASETDGSIQDLVHDAVTAATDPTLDPSDAVTDLSQYDALLVVHAGAGEESDVASDSSDDIWSLYYSSPDGIRSSETGHALTQTLSDGQPIREAIVMPQTNSQDGVVVDPLGVWVHEFGHWLGLPDLYCTAFTCTPDGAGRWSLMGDGIYNRVGEDAPYGSSPAHLDAWSKVFLGWVTPVTASADPGAVLLGAVEGEPTVYRLPVSSDPAAGAQYFLVENRQQTGFDAGLPGHGLLVWLVDEAIIGGTDCVYAPSSRYCQNTINNNPLRPGIKVVEADGDDALQRYGCRGTASRPDDCGGPGDPFPGTSQVVAFTPVSVPASSGYAAPAWVNLRDIAEVPGTLEVELSIGFGPRSPENVVADGRGKVSWTAPAAADETDPVAGYNVYRQGVLANATPLAAPVYQDPAAQAGVSYQVTALDAAGNESTFSAPAQLLTGGAGPSGSDSRCFVATAAYGSSLDPHVGALRAFRDRHLLTNAPGRAFVAAYYRWSPPAAALIRRHEPLRRAARWALAPVVALVEHPGLAWLLAAGAAGSALALRERRRARRRDA